MLGEAKENQSNEHTLESRKQLQRTSERLLHGRGLGLVLCMELTPLHISVRAACTFPDCSSGKGRKMRLALSRSDGKESQMTLKSLSSPHNSVILCLGIPPYINRWSSLLKGRAACQQHCSEKNISP